MLGCSAGSDSDIAYYMWCVHCVLCMLVYVDVREESRTQAWRNKKRRELEEAAAAGLAEPPPAKRHHKVHECSKCHQRLSSKWKVHTVCSSCVTEYTCRRDRAFSLLWVLVLPIRAQ